MNRVINKLILMERDVLMNLESFLVHKVHSLSQGEKNMENQRMIYAEIKIRLYSQLKERERDTFK